MSAGVAYADATGAHLFRALPPGEYELSCYPGPKQVTASIGISEIVWSLRSR